MEQYAPELKDLAPRDVVARAIVEEMTRNKEEFVYLDLANFYNGPQPIAERFPNIRKACAEIGVDIEKDPIPVVPAAHYFCGGVLVNTSGETTLAASTRSARRRAPASTARTGWRRRRCSKD